MAQSSQPVHRIPSIGSGPRHRDHTIQPTELGKPNPQIRNPKIRFNRPDHPMQPN